MQERTTSSRRPASRVLSGDELRRFDALIDELLDSVEGEADRPTDEILGELRGLVGESHAKYLWAVGVVAEEREGPAAAHPWFARAVEADDEDPELHYAVARCYEAFGAIEQQVEHDLRVRELDAKRARRDRISTSAQLAVIERKAAEVLDELPAAFRELLANVPIVLEPRPSRDLVCEGFDPRALGVFEGREIGDMDADLTVPSVPIPTRIVLFYANLLAQFVTIDQLEDEVEVTLLHEIGHFFGLDEDGVAELGLA